MLNRQREEETPINRQVLSPIDTMSPATVRAIREKAAKESYQALLRKEGCVDCPKLKPKRFKNKKKLIAAQVMNRLKGETPSYCCELENNEN